MIKQTESKKIKTLSLFSGAGGLDIGFHKAGYDIVACVEIEHKYCKTLLRNRDIGVYFSRDTAIHNVDIREFDAREYKDSGIECIIGGPPCQTFSAAGRRSGGVIGTDDDRGQLYEAYCKILEVLDPQVFIFENVYGLPGANGGGPWREILEAFSQYGYNLRAEVIDAADYGVPQHRERLIMVGTKSQNFIFPMPTVGPDSNSKLPLVSVNDAIGDLQKRTEKYSLGLGGLYGHLLPEVPEGLNYAFFTSEMGHPEPVFAWRSKFHDLLYKADRNLPCRTLKANPGKFTGPFHWKNRHFTIDELKRIQTFPDDYELVGSYSQIVEQIGNSVPPALAEVIAESVQEQILRPCDRLKHPVRSDEFKSTFRQRQRERSKRFKDIAQRAIIKKYGKPKSYDDYDISRLKPITSKYYSLYTSRFARLESKTKPKSGDFLVINTTELGSHIRMDIEDSFGSHKEYRWELSVSGLRKYLPHFDTLKLSFDMTGLDSIFYAWKEVERVLIDRSKFFTLIDIYGHYANRGDVVDVASNIGCESKDLLVSLLQFFGQTNNCGDFISLEFLVDKFQTSEEELMSVIETLRNMRYDIRTYETHPIIGLGNVLCTYPFPLLSEKAMVISRAKLNREKIDERQIRFA